jgi:glycosyltransferase involved in cell wall biosynthesis
MSDFMRNYASVKGRVTVITATYNAAATLPACLESVLSQNYHDIEHIVIDGGSKDATIDILKRYSDHIAFWISESDRGIYDAWNKGLKAATGEWIAFLGADDVYLSGAIRGYMDVAKETDVEYISSLVRWVPDPPERPKIIGTPWSWPAFQREMRPAHVGSMHHYTLFQRIGVYDLSYRITGDYELLLRPQGTLRTRFLPVVTVQMRAGGSSDSFAALKEAERAKVISGGRNRLTARIELWIKRGKLLIRRLSARGILPRL